MEEQQISQGSVDLLDPNACRYLNKSQQQCHAMNEHEKRIVQRAGAPSRSQNVHIFGILKFSVAWEENAICFIHGCLS